MVTLTVALDGTDSLLRRLNELSGSLDGPGLQAMLANVGESVVTQTKERFREQKRPDGGKWPKSRRAREEGGQTLTDRARLKHSIHKRLRPGIVEIGTNVEYAAIHQFGFAGQVNIGAHQRIIHQAFGRKLKFPVAVNVKAHSVCQEMPARPFLGISPANEKELLTEMNRFIARYLGMVG